MTAIAVRSCRLAAVAAQAGWRSSSLHGYLAAPADVGGDGPVEVEIGHEDGPQPLRVVRPGSGLKDLVVRGHQARRIVSHASRHLQVHLGRSHTLPGMHPGRGRLPLKAISARPPSGGDGGLDGSVELGEIEADDQAGLGTR